MMLKKSHAIYRKKFQISELPDEVVVSIISFLTIKEAIATSILSRRWRNLWTYTSGSWQFIRSNTIMDDDYAMLVNHALESHRGSVLKELVFRMNTTYYPLVRPIRPISVNVVENLINIASGKSVQRLDLYIPYPNFNNFVQPWPKFSQLTRLSLEFLSTSGEILHNLLSSCQLLEHLYLILVHSVGKIKIGGDSLLKLKYLEISLCYRLTNLKFSAPNLVTLVCRPIPTDLIMDVPRLTTLTIGQYVRFDPRRITEPLIHYLSQIESLSLSVELDYPLNQPNLDLRNLKHLELKIDHHCGKSLIPYTCLLKACPISSSLRIDLDYAEKSLVEILREEAVKFCKEEYERHKASIITRHECLKVVKICGFLGYKPLIELALHLIMIAGSLEKMVIQCTLFAKLMCKPIIINKVRERERAEVLASMIPSSTTEFGVS